MHSLVFAALLITSLPQPPHPYNIIENGDARSGDASWSTSVRPEMKGTVETCEGGPCFVLRNGASWRQFARLPEGSTGKYVLVTGRGSSERVWNDGNITGLPYLHASFTTEGRKQFIYVNSAVGTELARPSHPNTWVTMHRIVRIPEDAVYLSLMLGQAQRKGTPHNGSAARFMHVEARVFESEEAARRYLTVYNSQYAGQK